jgi:hypothetical protein
MESSRRHGRRAEEPARHDRGGRRRDRGRGGRDLEGEGRLEFDEVRSGPLLPPSGPLPEDDDESGPFIRPDDPLPAVGDPGPISVIHTGIDQTESARSRRRRRKADPAAREMSKEISDQPALQAFKRTEGDPRGHEAAAPRRKPRKTESETRPEKERPFDFVADFEAIEDVFRW